MNFLVFIFPKYSGACYSGIKNYVMLKIRSLLPRYLSEICELEPRYLHLFFSDVRVPLLEQRALARRFKRNKTRVFCG